MKIPSYDDLTPGISDVHPRDTFEETARVVQRAESPVVSTLRHRAPGRTPQHPAAPCSTLQHPAPGSTRTPQHPAAPWSILQHPAPGSTRTPQHPAAPWSTLQHPAPGSTRTLQHPAAPCSTLQHPAAPGSTRTLHPAAPSSTLQHPAAPAPCSTPQHPPAPCSTLIRSTPQHPDLFACLRARGATAAGLLALARDFSPRIECHGEACIVLDVSGLGRLLGDAHGIASALQQAAADRGVKLRLAVAQTQTAARLLTLHAEVSVVAGDVADALAPLPLTLLAEIGPPGLSDIRTLRTLRTLDALRRWGLRTIGELDALPADELSARFGAAGVGIHRLARGLDSRPLIPDPGVPRFVQSMELEWPLEELEPLSFVLARLLEPLSAALERADKGGAAIRLALRLVDRTTHTRVLQLPAPMRDPRVLRTLLLLDLESHSPAAAIDIVTIELDPAPARIVQFSLLERAIPSPETLATLTARLHALVGEDRCGSPVLIDSHRPDAFEMRRFNPDERRPAAGTLASPDAPLILRRFRPPLAVRVGIERGRPASVAIARRGMPGGRVEQSAGPWRSSGGWWNGAGTYWDHDEWDVALSDGSVCRVYCDRESGRWFLEGVVD